MEKSAIVCEIEQAILNLSLKEESICVHSSMRSFGISSRELPKMLADAFLENCCTVLVPTFSYFNQVRPIEKYMPKQNGTGDYSHLLNADYRNKEIFSIQSKSISTEYMGVFSEYVLKCDESMRSNHPLNSFAAIGKNASKLIEKQTPHDVYAPFKALCDLDGYILLMGVNLTSATAIHFAEELAGRTLFIRWAKNSNGETIAANCGSCSEGFNKFNDSLQAIEKSVVVGNSLWRCYKAKDLVKICTNEIKKNPFITHCSDDKCERCKDAILGGPYY